MTHHRGEGRRNKEPPAARSPAKRAPATWTGDRSGVQRNHRFKITKSSGEIPINWSRGIYHRRPNQWTTIGEKEEQRTTARPLAKRAPATWTGDRSGVWRNHRFKSTKSSGEIPVGLEEFNDVDLINEPPSGRRKNKEAPATRSLRELRPHELVTSREFRGITGSKAPGAWERYPLV